MFDTFINKSGPSHISASVTVTEKRAPTDDSVRLLNEMERKVLDQIVKTFHLRDNDFEAVMMVRQFSLSHPRGELYVAFKLNGKDYICREEVPRTFGDDQEQVIRKLFEAVGKAVAEEMFMAKGPDLLNSMRDLWSWK